MHKRTDGLSLCQRIADLLLLCIGGSLWLEVLAHGDQTVGSTYYPIGFVPRTIHRGLIEGHVIVVIPTGSRGRALHIIASDITRDQEETSVVGGTTT